MPVVNLHLVRGLKLEQKRVLVEEITNILSQVTGSRPDRTHVIIHEVADEDWGLEGRLVLDRRGSAVA